MIVKIAPSRRDGKSSFKDLAKYMTEGIEQSGEAPTKTSWDNLTQYITAESVLNALGENVEKTIGVEIGNVRSLAEAPAEMYAVASKATRVKNSVYHYILSWPEHERPATQDIFSAARDTLQALGMAEHQYIIAIHANTDNIHAHIEVNRVHPKTFKPQHLAWDYPTLHEAARRAEIKYGWHHDNGMFQVVVVNGKKHVVKSTDHIDPDLVPTRPGANRAEVWTGEQSLETWCKGAPATDLKRVLDDDATASWQDIHRVLGRHGLELQDTGGGGFKVVDVSAAMSDQTRKLPPMSDLQYVRRVFDEYGLELKDEGGGGFSLVGTNAEKSDIEGKSLAAVIKRSLEDASTTDWQDIHRVLGAHGLELKETDGGTFKVVGANAKTPDKAGKPMAIRASAAFRFMKRKELEARLGAFEARSPDLKLDEPARTYKRDPHKRLESRLARKALRDELQKRFKAEERAAREKHTLTKNALKPYVKGDKDRHQKLQDAYKAQRQVIRLNRNMSPVQQQQAYMLARLVMIKARDQLVMKISGERTVRRELFSPIPTWREWVEQEAQRGDEAAISALRGMIYQDGRDMKKKLARDAAQADENAILPATLQDTDPQIRGLGNLVWKVSKNGRVNYSFSDGEPAFRDEGERLTFGRKDVSDEALALTLKYGADKWRDGIQIGGGDFAFNERMVRMAVSQGITIKNVELQGLEKQIRDEMEALRNLRRKAPNEPAKQIAGSSVLLTGVSVREDDIEMLVRGLDRRATLSNAVTEGKAYTGPIVAQNARYLAQNVSKHGYVLHERSAFNNPPEHGQSVTIQYRSGKATVQTAKARSTRDSR